MKRHSAHLDANISRHYHTPPLNSAAHPASTAPTNAHLLYNRVVFDGHAGEEIRHIYIQSKKKLHQHSEMNKDHIQNTLMTFWVLSSQMTLCEAGRHAHAHKQKQHIMPETNFWPSHPCIFSYGTYFIHHKHWILVCSIHRAPRSWCSSNNGEQKIHLLNKWNIFWYKSHSLSKGTYFFTISQHLATCKSQWPAHHRALTSNLGTLQDFDPDYFMSDTFQKPSIFHVFHWQILQQPVVGHPSVKEGQTTNLLLQNKLFTCQNLYTSSQLLPYLICQSPSRNKTFAFKPSATG